MIKTDDLKISAHSVFVLKNYGVPIRPSKSSTLPVSGEV